MEGGLKSRDGQPLTWFTIAGEDKKFAPVGTGTLDFKAILAAADKNGVRWGFVEQDQTYGMPPLEAIKTSFENLKKLGMDPKADPLAPR